MPIRLGWARLRGPLAHGTRHHLCWEKVETARISDRTDGAASAGNLGGSGPFRAKSSKLRLTS